MSDLPPYPGPDPDSSASNPYGTPPPPPPPAPGGYGTPAAPPPPGFDTPFSVTAAVGYGWRTFRNNVGPFLGVTLLTLVLSGIFGALSGGQEPGYSRSASEMIFQVIGQVVGLFMAAALVKGALDATAGRPVSIGAMFEGWSKVQVLIAAVLVSIGTIVGLVLLIIPGLIWMFLTWFNSFFVIDRGESAVTAIGSSMKFTSGHVGQLLLLTLLCIGVLILGVLCLVVGLLVAVPVVMIAATYAYRVLQNQPVAIQA